MTSASAHDWQVEEPAPGPGQLATMIARLDRIIVLLEAILSIQPIARAATPAHSVDEGGDFELVGGARAPDSTERMPGGATAVRAKQGPAGTNEEDQLHQGVSLSDDRDVHIEGEWFQRQRRFITWDSNEDVTCTICQKVATAAHMRSKFHTSKIRWWFAAKADIDANKNGKADAKIPSQEGWREEWRGNQGEGSSGSRQP